MPKQIRNAIFLFPNTLSAFRLNGSVIPYGMMYGKGVNQVVLSRLDYVFNSRKKHLCSLLSSEMNRAITLVDAKPFLRNCSCGKPADCFISPGYLQSLIFKCSTCQPPGDGTTNPQWRVGWSLDDLDHMFGGTYAQIRKQIQKATRCIIVAKGYNGNITFLKANKFV
jgi:hypothetical protein